jgi:hypothetical protein
MFQALGKKSPRVAELALRGIRGLISRLAATPSSATLDYTFRNVVLAQEQPRAQVDLVLADPLVDRVDRGRGPLQLLDAQIVICQPAVLSFQPPLPPVSCPCERGHCLF